MSINAINNADPYTAYRNKILTVAGVGAVAGGAVAASGKRYLYDGAPSDTFVKKVSKKLRKEMPPEETKEAKKINKFLAKATDPQTDLETLKPMIKDSKELSDAIKSTPDEAVDKAINRVYSQPKAKVRQDLLSLQQKTKSDKIASTNTALKLLNDNFDASTKKLVKNENTSDKVFGMMKKTAKNIQVKSVAALAATAGVIAGALCMVATDVPNVANK